MRQRLLLFAMMLATTIVAVGQGVTMRFTARTANGAWHPFDSVRIENLTHGWSVTTPDSVVTYGSSTQGIGEAGYGSSTELRVYPNPFAGRTEALLEQPAGGTVKIRVMRINGTVIAQRDEQLDAGVYRIGITLSQPQVAFLCVESGGQTTVTKLVSCAGGGSDRLAVDWLTSVVNRGSATKDSDDFSIGDQVRCTAISYSSGARTESEPTTLYLAAENDITLVFSDGSTGGGDTASGGFDENGASYALFSVAEGRQVQFSRGNLQYTTTGSHATADGGTAIGTWRFAEHQYDYIGEGNANIFSTDTGWIDLFMWGTSGWDSGADIYEPWSNGNENHAHTASCVPGGHSCRNGVIYNLTDAYDYADWGVYNAISNGGNQPGMWRTLTKDEWRYLLFQRPAQNIPGTYNGRYATTAINGPRGIVIFPDNFVMPSGLDTLPTEIYAQRYNLFWNRFEAAGCIFLPVTGDLNWTMYSYGSETLGFYWSTTASGGDKAYYMWFGRGFDGTFSNPQLDESIYTLETFSVRLVKDPSSHINTPTTNPSIGGFDQNGASNAVFTVGPGRTVRFSKGNLQYTTTGSHATADGGTAVGTWRFAEHQYDNIVEANENISSSYTGWIDLFRWGTSGWDNGQPWSLHDGLEGSLSNLTEAYANADWGVYNAISNGGNQPGMWRTLTADEWHYLLRIRRTSASGCRSNARFVEATISTIRGLIIFPDTFTMPEGLPIPESINCIGNTVYSYSQWSQLEDAGCIFLPVTGYMNGSSVSWWNGGGYWSSTYSNRYNARTMEFQYGRNPETLDSNSRGGGYAVRLVQDNYSSDSLSSFDENGASNAVFSVEEGRTVHFSRGNLQYQASTNTWRFAENQYDCIGADNHNISSTYSGWIDLFGWGTSGWNSGAICYQPWSTSTTESDYYPGGSATNNLSGSYANADWGVYNHISNGGNQTGMWRTLTFEEWGFLMYIRDGSTVSGIENARFAKATIGNVAGLIVFPDSFTMPTGISVVASSVNSTSAAYTDNTYNITQWSRLESAGTLFLPAAGFRNGTDVNSVGALGYYWANGDDSQYGGGAWSMGVPSGEIGTMSRYYGQSVRLVRD